MGLRVLWMLLLLLLLLNVPGHGFREHRGWRLRRERERDGEDEGTVRGVMKFGRGKGGPGEKFNQPQGSSLGHARLDGRTRTEGNEERLSRIWEIGQGRPTLRESR